MRAYAALGDRAAIARTYQMCTTALHMELGITPSSEIKTVFLELTS